MTRDELVAVLKRRLGNVRNKDSIIVTNLQLAQKRLEKIGTWNTYPWFLTVWNASLTSEADPNFDLVAKPAGFLKEIEEDSFWYYSATEDVLYNPLTKMDRNTMINRDQSVNPDDDEPTVLTYCDFGDYFQVRPAPTEVLDFRLSYYKTATAFNDYGGADTDNDWSTNAEDVILNRAGMLCALDFQNPTQYQAFAAEYSVAKQEIEDSSLEKILANQPMRMQYG